MSRLLTITWNPRLLRYILADSNRQGQLRLVDAGQTDLSSEGGTTQAVCSTVQELVERLKAEKARLLILINRGSVDSATFSVPPASDAELPALVQNLAVREIPGATDETPIDFIAYPVRPDGTRTISAMALVAEDHLLVRQLMAQSGCRSQRVLISTHPLRSFVPQSLPPEGATADQADAATLIVSRGDDAADVLLTVSGLPLLSRTIRLAADIPQAEINRYLRTEMQRMLISAGGQMEQPPRIAQVVVVGNEQQTLGLDDVCSKHFEVDAVVVRPTALLQEEQTPESLLAIVDSGSFAPMLAAALEEASSRSPAVDFANPRRPPVQTSRVRQVAAVTAVVLLICVAGGYYVWSQFHDIDAENAGLVVRLNELNQLVRETQARRQLVTTLTAWEKNRISWPDEFRDLTIRIPSSPELTVQQLSIASAGAGTAVATFRGIASQPEVIAQMEQNLRDRYHDIRIPGVREQQQGNKVLSAFQATVTIRSRTPAQYSGLPSPTGVQQKSASVTREPQP